jgi:hypothetical protein
MSTIDHARKRIATVIEEIERLKQSEFPYIQPSNALDLLERKFKQQQSVLNKVSPSAPRNVIDNACSTSLYQLYLYVPILGFILRSTNVRNAFEIYAPLLRLARSILGDDTKLILSSEWEFSPLVYRSITDLPGFVLIGLPAPESSNPLLVPLAGHELGHSLWEREGLSTKFQNKIREGILVELTTKRWDQYTCLYPQYQKRDLQGEHLFAYKTWASAYTWALSQLEEIFCDIFGLRLFAESYLHAFEYLISPGIYGQRPLHYPNIKRRVTHLVDAANAKGVAVPPGFETGFVAETEPEEPATQLLVSVADSVSASLVSELIALTWEFADSRDVPTRNSEHVSDICREFLPRVVPTQTPRSLVDLVNAGWKCHQDSDLWKNVSQIKLEDRDRILGDLMLKSMEVSEIHERLEE